MPAKDVSQKLILLQSSGQVNSALSHTFAVLQDAGSSPALTLGMIDMSVEATLHVYAQDVRLVRSLLQRHSRYTHSPRAKALLSDWNTTQGHFVKIYPHEFRRAMEEADKTKVCLLQLIMNNTFSVLQAIS